MDDEKLTMVNPKVTLDDITAFLSKQPDLEQSASLEERTDYAINLLQSLPCARYAVLEKIGEVFFDETKHYMVEVERQHLADLPAYNYYSNTRQGIQIEKIQKVLVLSIEANSKAWAPMIFQWSVQTLSQICGEYGNKSRFSSLTFQDRFKLWLDCTATKVLLEIIITCLHKIIHKNQENCLKRLLAATLSCSPYFDWAFAHICFIFHDMLPFKLLYHSLEAFANQSRRVEVLIKTMLMVFNCIYPRKKDVVTSAIFQLFEESLTEIEDENVESNHITLCVVPFLLHLSTKSMPFFLPLIDKVINCLTHKTLTVLSKQSLKREGVLQRGLLRRIVECIKLIDRSSYNVLHFLMKYAFNEDRELTKSNPALAVSMQTNCYNIIDYLMLHLKTDVNVYSHQQAHPNPKQEMVSKTPFVVSLSTYCKQICNQMTSAVESKRLVLQEILVFMGLQEGRDKMVEVLSCILLNNQSEGQHQQLNVFASQFQITEKHILKDLFHNIFNAAPIYDQFSEYQIRNLLDTIHFHTKEKHTSQLELMGYVKNYVKEISGILLFTDNDELAITTMKVLKVLCCDNLRISEYSVVVQSVLFYYFKKIEKFKTQDTVDGDIFREIGNIFQECDSLLILIINEYKGVQQLVVRILLESILKDAIKITDTEPEKSLIKVELLEKNYLFDRKARFSNSATSINYRDGLNLNKRKYALISQDVEKQVTQFFIVTLMNVLSISTNFTSANKMEVDKNLSFATVWSEKTYSHIFPSAYAFTASFLVELVCPEVIGVTPWPDEDFLKYTIERDLKVKNMFYSYDILWNILEIISVARPSLYHCSTIIQSLFGVSLKFWKTNRSCSVDTKSVELKKISHLLFILKQAGWLPNEFNAISDIFHLIKPKEVYEILSAIWKYLKIQDFAPDKFIDRDQLGRPQLSTDSDHIEIVQSDIKIIFLRNITSLGQHYHRFLKETPH